MDTKMRAGSMLFVILFLALAGCGGSASGNSDSEPAPLSPVQAPQVDFTISGTITYERVFFDDTGSGLDYSTRQNFPAREIVVDLIDAAGELLIRSRTDAQGNYSFNLQQSGDYRIVASARLANTDTRVTDNTDGNSLYQLQSSLASAGPESSVRNMHASIGWGSNAFISDRAAAPFAILDTVYEGIRRLEEGTGGVFSADQLPATELRWSVNNRPTVGERSVEDLEAGDIGGSFYTTGLGVIYLLGAANNDTDEFDQHVVLHEWTHYLIDALSRSDSIGGSHSLNNKLDLRLAWGEGIATAIAAILLDDPEYRDSSGANQSSEFFFSVESPASASIGWYSESTVLSLIYDIYDVNADGFDNLNVGLLPIWQALTDQGFLQQDSATSIYSMLDRIDAGESEAAFLNLISASQIVGVGDWGDGEENHGGIDEALPVYYEIPIGQTETVCADNRLGFPNKLGNRRLIRFDNPGGERISITADSIVAQETDPDLYLYRRGQCEASATSSSPDGAEKLVTELPGTLVLDLQDWWKLNPDLTDPPAPSQPDHSCFAVSVAIAAGEPLSQDCGFGDGSSKHLNQPIYKPGANIEMQVSGNTNLDVGTTSRLEVVLNHQYLNGLATISFNAPSGIQLGVDRLQVDLAQGYSIPLELGLIMAGAGKHYIAVDVLIEVNGISERRAFAIPIEATDKTSQ